MTETRDLLLDAAGRLFAARCDTPTLDRAEGGAWPAGLWDAVARAGFPRAMLPEAQGGSGAAPSDAFAILHAAGRCGAPVPIAETMLAGALLHDAGLPAPDGPLTIAPVRRRDRLVLERRGAGWHLRGAAARVPWARDAAALAVLAESGEGPMVARLDRGGGAITPGANLAGEPRDTIEADAMLPADAVAPSGFGPDRLRALGAAMRTAQIAGALARVLEMTVEYARLRVQFGRPIGQFQAVQQSLAVLAGQAAAASAAADMAADAAGRDFDPVAIGAAKSRAGEAAGQGAAIAHQVHGAIGFTAEYGLQRLTRRLWSWRDEFGNEAEWNLLVGRAAAEAGADRLWATLAAI